MIYQYFNINPIRIINQEILLLTGPKKWEADSMNQVYLNDRESAIWAQDSRENTINCNTVTNTWTGLTFMGTCIGGNGTIIRSNDIGDHNIGLLYKGASTRVDHQDFRGNYWFLSVYPDIAARDEDAATAQLDKYIVDGNGPRIPPDTHTNHPDNVEVDPSQFIVDDFGGKIDENCGNKLLHNADCNVGTGDGDGGSDRRAAQNQEGSQEFDEETKWKTRERLYEKLLSEPAYLDSDTVFVTFYQSMAGSYLQKIASLNIGKDELYANQNALSEIIQSRSEIIYNNSILIRAIDSTLKADGLVDSLIDSIKNVKVGLLQNTNQLLLLNNASIDILATAVEQNTDNLISENAVINSQKVYEENEKAENDAYLQTIAKNQIDLLGLYSSTLISIASQCPLSGGPAVYRARSLVRILDPTLRYDDELTCAQGGYTWRMSHSENVKTFFIYPNPTSDKLTVLYSLAQSGQLRIFDQMGKLVKEFSLSENNLRTEVDVIGLISGVYSCELLSSDGSKESQQLVIIH